MKQFNLAISNSYGFIETIPIPLDVTDEDIDKIVDDYVKNFRDKLKVHYLCRYEEEKNSWNHQKFWDREQALEFIKQKMVERRIK